MKIESLDGTCAISDFIRIGQRSAVFDNLTPERYLARAFEGNLVETGVEFEVVARTVGDTDFNLVLGVRVGAKVLFRPSLHRAPGTSLLGGVLVRALSETGEELATTTLGADDFELGYSSAGFCLPRGAFTFEGSHPLAGRDSKSAVLERVGGEAFEVVLNLNR